jgi:hypothetical protein
MTLRADMDAPLTELARCRAMVAQGMTGAALSERMGAAIACLEEVAQHVAAIDASPVPQHWLPQRDPTWPELRSSAVVSLALARAQRGAAKVARL